MDPDLTQHAPTLDGLEGDAQKYGGFGQGQKFQAGFIHGRPSPFTPKVI
jgi:hypothetical protein